MEADQASLKPQRLRWVCLLIAVVGLLMLATPMNEKLSRPWVDLQLRMLGTPAPITGVAVIDIDESSLQRLRPDVGLWPYPRDVYALAISELRRAGVRAVALNLVLAEPRVGDSALAREIARPGAPVVLSATARGPVQPPTTAGPGADAAWAQLVMPSETILDTAARSAQVGVISLPLDSDGHLRRWPLWHEVDGQRWPSLPMALWQATHRTDAQNWPPPGGAGRATVPIAEPAGSVTHVPFSLVIDAAVQRAPREALSAQVRDRVVIVGASALQSDLVLSSAGPISGSEALAQAYAALEARRLARMPQLAIDGAITALAGLPLLAVTFLRRRSLRQGMAALGLGTLLVGLVLAAALWAWGQLTQPAAAAVVLMASAVCLAAWRQRDLQRSQALLIEQRRRADESSRLKSEFLANVSHEIRTPMNAVLGAAELLSRRPLPPADRELVNLFTDAGRRLLTLLDDMLDLSRIEAGRLELQPSNFALRDMLVRVSALVRQRAERKGLALNLALHQELPEGVRGDSQRLEQILLNLLSNAVNFTERGAVTLEVRRDGEVICFVVTDTGIGIAPNKLGLIFEPFAQADGSLSRHYGGTGLGLSIVRQLTEAMGGHIEAASEPGRGSRFTLRLPLPAAEPPPAPPIAPTSAETAADAPTQPLSGLRVLLVEDNDVNVLIFESMLDGLGLTVQVASNGAQGFERLRAGSCDLAFVDIQMPVMDGLTMTRLWRSEEATRPDRPRIPLIALTANAYATDARLSQEAGFDDHISKPHSRQQLLDAIARFAPDGRSPARPASAPIADAPCPPSPLARIDRELAVQQLGSPTVYEEKLRHARVFIGGWEADFRLAQRQEQLERQRALARDLRSTLTAVGALRLAERGAELERHCETGASATVEAQRVLADLRTHLPAVLIALERR